MGSSEVPRKGAGDYRHMSVVVMARPTEAIAEKEKGRKKE
jgi:hypothetical protein